MRSKFYKVIIEEVDNGVAKEADLDFSGAIVQAAGALIYAVLKNLNQNKEDMLRVIELVLDDEKLETSKIEPILN